MQQVVTRDHAVYDDRNIKEQFDVLMFEQPPDLIQLSNAQIVLFAQKLQEMFRKIRSQ